MAGFNEHENQFYINLDDKILEDSFKKRGVHSG